tara:strand:+ start:61 stop:267 length:207 start_codon:yes stop_codon:yes gene_type:complete
MDRKTSHINILKTINKHHLVALRSAITKLKKRPKLSEPLIELFEILKYFVENQQSELYSEDGFLDIED